MAISVTCPLCEKNLHVPSSAGGRNVRCPDCNASVAVPGGADGKFRLTSAGRHKLILTIAIIVVFGVILIAAATNFAK